LHYPEVYRSPPSSIVPGSTPLSATTTSTSTNTGIVPINLNAPLNVNSTNNPTNTASASQQPNQTFQPGINGVTPPPDKGRPTFGVDLAEQMVRDNAEVPPIMVKCCEAIERHGISNQGVYRVSGTMRKIHALRAHLDKGSSASGIGCHFLISVLNEQIWTR